MISPRRKPASAPRSTNARTSGPDFRAPAYEQLEILEVEELDLGLLRLQLRESWRRVDDAPFRGAGEHARENAERVCGRLR